MLTLIEANREWEVERARRVIGAYRRGKRTVHIVGGNRLDVYALANAAKAAGLDARSVLSASILARAFTAHQLSTLVEETLPALLRDDVGLAILADPLDQYAGEEVGWEDGIALLQRAVAKMRLLSRRRPQIPFLLVQRRGIGTPRHWEILLSAIDARETVESPILRNKAQARIDRWIAPQEIVARPPEVMAHGPHPANVPQLA